VHEQRSSPLQADRGSGFSAIEDYVTYDVRAHDTDVDTDERVREQDWKQNAVSTVWFAGKAAMLDRHVPR
jgi:hypothetical protein